MKYLRGKRAAYFGNMKTLRRTHSYKVFHISSLVLLIKIGLIVLLYLVATNSIMLKDYKPISDTDYVLLIDDSSSMAKSDFEPNRLTSAKNIATRWIKILPNSTSVGVVGFSKGIDVTHGMSYDRQEQLDTIDEISINYSRSGTNLDYAIQYSTDLMEEAKRNKTILLFTDGTQDVSNDTIDEIKKNNIKLIVFGIGDNTINEEFADIPIEFRNSFNTLEFNFSKIEDLTNKTNGVAFKVSNSQELEDSFNQATLEEIQISLDSGYYVTILIAIISILELLIYSRLGAL